MIRGSMLAWLFLTAFSVSGADAEFFPLMGWNSAPNDPAVLNQMRECGLTIAGFAAPSALDACRAAGLKAIVSDARASGYSWGSVDRAAAEKNISKMVEEVGNHPAVFGFYLTDEPGAGSFPGLAEVSKLIREKAPGKWAYINLFPNYATSGQLGVPTYEEYLSRFVSSCDPLIVSYDHYAFYEGNSFRSDLYWLNLEQVRSAAVQAGRPFWNIVQCMGGLRFREVGAPELRLQVFSSLAYGARGISYFQYQASPVGNFRGTPLDQFGHATPTWHVLQNINLQVQKLAPVLLKLTSTSVYHFGEVPKGSRGPSDASWIRTLGSNCMAGEFTHSNGSRYVLIVNRSLTASEPCNPQFRIPVKRLMLVSPYSGGETPFEGEQRWLAPGQGSLLRIE